jgi:ribonuclease III
VNLIKFFNRLFAQYSSKDKQLIRSIKTITGSTPYNIRLYELAMKHSSIAEFNEKGIKESNERLEYLGDAVLGTVVAEYLFKRFPYKDEGFLTEIRSRIVNRESLNRLAVKIGLSELVEFDARKRNNQSHKSLYGDAMEAFIGAMYLDKGFEFCKIFIVRKLIMHHFDIDEVVETTTNFKSSVIEWGQKNNKEVQFLVVDEIGAKHKRQFKTILTIGDEEIAEGFGYSKKKAEQDAARKACEKLGIIPKASA